MAKFLTDLVVRELDDSIFQVAYHSFEYVSEVLNTTVIVPVGFKTDFASVPRIGFIYAFLGDTAHEPAVIHDWLYYTAEYSREKADATLLEAMKCFGIPAAKRYPIYWGVRIGGWYAWNQHRKNGDGA